MTAVLVGAVIALVVADALGRVRVPPARWRGTMPTRRRMARAAGLVTCVVLLLVAPPAALLVPVVGVMHRRRRAVHAARAHARAVRAALPDLVDLLVLACSAGLSLPVAHPLVAASTPEPVGPALVAAHEAAARGRPRADALVSALAPLGERAHALAQVLADHLRYGVPLLAGLERTGFELRLDRRRAAEVEARRVPVRLLGPLVTCILPAFALLTVVPLLAASLEALPT